MSDIPSWSGTRVGDRVGANVGTVCDVYFDDATSRAAWLLVSMPERTVLVPCDGALAWSDRVIVPHDREVIATAPVFASPPNVLVGEPLLRLARHYGVRVDRCAGCVALHGQSALSVQAA
jgi:sporulation protein YlmC with PRC-barrel domain